MEVPIQLGKGNFIKVRVWRYSLSGAGIIVASAKDANEFYKAGSSVIIRKEDDWELLELSFYVPENLTNNQLYIYLWNNGNSDVYFDDLRIKEFK